MGPGINISRILMSCCELNIDRSFAPFRGMSNSFELNKFKKIQNFQSFQKLQIHFFLNESLTYVLHRRRAPAAILAKDSRGKLFVNLDPAMFQIMLEAKYLDRLGYSVPPVALNVTLQDEKFHRQRPTAGKKERVVAEPGVLEGYGAECWAVQGKKNAVLVAVEVYEVSSRSGDFQNAHFTSGTSTVASHERTVCKFLDTTHPN